MRIQKRQKLTCKLLSITKDFFGVFSLKMLCAGRVQTFELYSEFLVRKINSMLRHGETDKAFNTLTHSTGRRKDDVLGKQKATG
jgi:hypothetical protein